MRIKMRANRPKRTDQAYDEDENDVQNQSEEADIRRGNNDNIVSNNRLRSNLVGTIKLISSLQFTEQHKDELQRTPFWSLISAILDNKFTPAMTRKYDQMVYKLSMKFKKSPSRVFQFGDKVLRITPTDIKVLFGICCGNLPFPKTQKVIPTTPFASRISKDGKVNASHIKTLLVEKITKRRRVDLEDVARLVCLYLCVNLFFSTSGAQVSWEYVRVVENLTTIKKYDWATAICNYLVKSLVHTSDKPAKLKGCTVAILYWWCEHTHIIERIGSDEQIPRILKWSLADLKTRMKSISLEDHAIVEAINTTDVKLINAERETLNCCNIHTDEDDDDFVPIPQQHTAVKSDNDNDCSNDTEPATNPTQWDGIDELINIAERDMDESVKKSVNTNNLEVQNQKLKEENSQLRRDIQELELRVQNQSEELQQSRLLHRQLEEKNVDLLQVIERQKVEMKNMQSKIQNLEIEKQQVTDNIDVDLARVVSQYERQLDSNQNKDMHKPSDSPKVNSMIVKLKGKSQKATRLPEYEYSYKKRKTGPSSKKEGESSNAPIVVQKDDNEQTRTANKKLELTRRYEVFRELQDEDIKRLKLMYQLEGENAIVWSNGSNIEVPFNDIRKLVMGTGVTNNVIDAYAEQLMKVQELLAYNGEYETSYIFTSRCVGLIKGHQDATRKKLLDDQFLNKESYRWLIFPIYNIDKFHWTLYVYDTVELSWRFHNSLRPRSGIVDTDFELAKEIKTYYEAFLAREHERKYGMPFPEALIGTTRSSDQTPQQNPESADCGVIVCYIMEMYIENDPDSILEDFKRMGSVSYSAKIVGEFLHDADNGWNEDAARERIKTHS